MQKQVIFAVDVSGSTNRSTLYWKNVNDIYKENINRITKILFWSDFVVVVSKDALEYRIKQMSGTGGTSPQMIIPFINSGDDLILITDGEIHPAEVCTVDNMMKDFKLNSCDAHVISPHPNVSVICCFTRGITSSVSVHWSVSSLITKVSGDEFIVLQELDKLSVSDFLDKYDKIYQVIVNVTTGAPDNKVLHDNIVKLKARMLKEFVESNKGTHKFPDMVTTDTYSEAKEMSKLLIKEYYGSSEITDFSAKFDKLISRTANTSNFSINSYNPIQTNSFATANVVEQSDIESLADIEIDKTVQCPILLDVDSTVIPILEGDPILYGIDKEMANQIQRNPLSILSSPELIEKIKNRISPHFGLEAYCTIMENSKLHPTTRANMVSCIPLGCQHSYVNEASKAIIKLFTGGKILGNVDLYYAVLYFVTKDIGYLSNVHSDIREQLIYRMKTHKTSASLSGMADFVNTRILFKDAVWFTLTSGSLYTNNAHIPLRSHIYVTDHLLELNELNGYYISTEDREYIRKTKMLLRSLFMCKKNKNYKNEVKSKIQNHMVIDNFIVFIDGVNPDFDVNDTDTILEFVCSKLVNQNMNASQVNVSSIDLSSYSIENNWDYEVSGYEVPICTATCRPFYKITDDITWEISHKRLFTDKKVLSENKYFGEFVCEMGKYPSITDLILYSYVRETSKENAMSTLPITMVDDLTSIVTSYNNVITKITPEEFSKRFKKSANRETRMIMEDEERKEGVAKFLDTYPCVLNVV